MQKLYVIVIAFSSNWLFLPFSTYCCAANKQATKFILNLNPKGMLPTTKNAN